MRSTFIECNECWFKGERPGGDASLFTAEGSQGLGGGGGVCVYVYEIFLPPL